MPLNEHVCPQTRNAQEADAEDGEDHGFVAIRRLREKTESNCDATPMPGRMRCRPRVSKNQRDAAKGAGSPLWVRD